MRTSKLILLAVSLFSSVCWSRSHDFNDMDILEIPRLSKKLTPGTLAWATVDQLHPLQPQTGLREVLRKTDDFVELLEKAAGKFPDDLYETMIKRNYIIPVYIGQTPKHDSRFGREDVLGYGSDRTHKVSALAYAYRRVYGREALAVPMLSRRGRPLNFVLVRIMENKSDLSPEQFAKSMIKDQHCYLESWSRAKDGRADIQRIAFSDLPEKVYETGDNPFRGAVGALQHRDLLERVPVDFSQFALAKQLAQCGVVSWDDISLEAPAKRYKEALEKAADFFSSKSTPKDLKKLCQRLLVEAS